LESNALVNRLAGLEISLGAESLKTYCSRVDSNAVILIVDFSSVNDDVRAGSDIEAIGIVTTCTVTSRIINRHTGDGKAIATSNTNSLDRGVLDVQVGNGRRGECVRCEELGLRFAAITYTYHSVKGMDEDDCVRKTYHLDHPTNERHQG
jgi:hypothetical protein